MINDFFFQFTQKLLPIKFEIIWIFFLYLFMLNLISTAHGHTHIIDHTEFFRFLFIPKAFLCGNEIHICYDYCALELFSHNNPYITIQFIKLAVRQDANRKNAIKRPVWVLPEQNEIIPFCVYLRIHKHLYRWTEDLFSGTYYYFLSSHFCVSFQSQFFCASHIVYLASSNEWVDGPLAMQ